MRYRFCIFLSILFCTLFGTDVYASSTYTVRLQAHKGMSFPVIKNFGIKGNASGGSIEVRMYYEPYYFTGGRSDKSLIYGTKITNDSPNSYGSSPWIVQTSGDNAPWYCTLFSHWWCGSADYSVRSDKYQDKMHAYFNYVGYKKDVSIVDYINDSDILKTMPVVIEVEFTGNATLKDLIEINLPGLHPITKEYFHALQVKGINFQIRPTATKTQLDNANETYDQEAVADFPISENLMTGHFELAYSIAIPRNLPSGVPRNIVYGTNLAVYPISNLYKAVNENYDYFFYATATDQSLVSSLGSETPIEIKSLFKAMVNGQEETFKLFKIPRYTNDRVLIKGITKLGPFPTEEHGDIQIMAPEVTTLNPKMHDKINLPDNEKYLVAWHRGDWRGVPENTLESIQAAKDYDLLELDVSRAGGDLNSNHVPDYVLFHDPFMFRESSTGPTDGCVDPYDKLLVNSTLLALAQRQNLKNELMSRFPGYSPTDYDNWIKGPGDFTFSELTAMKVRDRFGCLTDINIPAFGDAVDVAKQFSLAIMVDKGWDDIDGIYWTAIEHDFENNVYFKGGANRPVAKLVAQYGDQLMKQIGYTPFYFDNVAQLSTSLNHDGKVQFLEEFVTKEHTDGWNIPGYELQIKMMESDGTAEQGFSPGGIKLLLDFNTKHKESKWIGITQINPTAYNGFDNKIIYMDAGPDPRNANSYSSRFDRRADPIFNLNYLECDYWTTDRPDVIIDFLKTLGKTN
ncbi:hypothetical protein [Winogradskyella sp.]|uniref:hypothetical protein n=1 Tax=Winogradskyella sp. TaxID=1883156 RepID=UPI0026077FDD|nr:hypothetical protein [Winogradskyella sp.]